MVTYKIVVVNDPKIIHNYTVLLYNHFSTSKIYDVIAHLLARTTFFGFFKLYFLLMRNLKYLYKKVSNIYLKKQRNT